jgi:hypothetical protein
MESIVNSVQAGFGVVVFDSLHKMSSNPTLRSLDLPINNEICASWKKDNDNPSINIFVNHLGLIAN